MSEENVLRDIELGNQAWLLAYQANSQRESVSWIVDGHFAVAIDFDRTRIRGLHAEEDLHQGRFTSPVFAHQGVDFSCPEVKIHSLQRLDARKRFDDAFQLEKQLWRGINVRHLHCFLHGIGDDLTFGPGGLGKSLTLSMVMTACGDTIQGGMAWQPRSRKAACTPSTPSS